MMRNFMNIGILMLGVVISEAFLPLSIITKRSLSSWSNSFASNKIEIPEDTPSIQLIKLLQDRRKIFENREKIDEQIESLAKMEVRFDPLLCLNGPFYASVYQQGPLPLWEKLSVLQSNMKGQQYSINVVDNTTKVLNYSEVVGKSLYLCASGSFERSIIAPMKSNEVVERVSRESDSTLGAIYSLLNLKIAFKQKKENLLKCPVDYTVYVTKGSFNIFGNTVSLPINGTGYLRCLYADKFCRIFTSPKDTTNTKWEAKGLKVVQIRSDLIDPKFQLPKDAD